MRLFKIIPIIVMCLLAAPNVWGSSRNLYTADKMSSSMICCVTQDRYGYIWVGTEYGLNKFDGYRFTNYFSNPNDSTSINDNDVTTFLVDRQGRLWIGTRIGLSRYVYKQNSFCRYPFPDGITPRVETIFQNADGDILVGTAGYGIYAVRSGEDHLVKLEGFKKRGTDDYVTRLFEDDSHHLWRGNHMSRVCRTKVNNLNPTSNKEYELAQGPVVNFLKTSDRKGFLLVCTYGILRYDYSTATISDAGYDLSALEKGVSIRKAMFDKQGNLYLGTSGCGLMMVPRGSKKFVQVESPDYSFDLTTANVNDIFEDKDANLWISCYKKGLFELNQSHEAFSSSSFSMQNYHLGSSVSSIAAGADGDVWCTVQKSGVYHFDRDGRITKSASAPDGANTIYKDRQGGYWIGTENAVYRYNPQTGASERKVSLDGWDVNCMADDGEGTLFISNFGKGLCIYDSHSGETRHFSMYQYTKQKGGLCNDWIKSIYLDSRGLLWLGCSDGLSCMNPSDGNFLIFGWDRLLPGYQCFSLCESPNGNMLIGTNAGLYLFDRKKNKLMPFPEGDQLMSKSIFSIAIDKVGDIWMGTAMGIWQYDAKGKKFISHINGNGLQTREYIVGAIIHEAGDRIVFGANDGITSFYPSDVRQSSMKMGEVFLSNFIVNGKSMDPLSDYFVIPYDDNNFTMEFSLLNYRNADNIVFQYRINQGEWIPTPEGTNSIPFTKVKPGKYVVEVRAMNNGTYSASTRVITVRVKDPWYSSTWAYMAYALLLLSALAMVAVYYDRRRRAELEEAKMRFLINATHDIRSPLTLIMGPLKKLKTRMTDAESLNDIETIDRNAQRLLLLVNQILDERRIDKNQMHLHCRETDLVKFVAGVCTLYQYNAHQRSITLTHEVQGQPQDANAGQTPAPINVWIDRANFDKVLSNLLSNALKYTFDGGDIKFVLSADDKNATIRLIDSGIGFKEEKTERLFERFYQGRNAEDLHIEGTGIGLNLSRAIVQLHGGTIRAYNRTDGQQGAVLEVTLPLGNAHLRPEEIEEKTEDEATVAEKKKQPTKNFRIMVVDDDREIATYIASELGRWYKFELYPNGKEALKALLTEPFDLVISDVMMPEMDGITLLKQIKGNTNVSDIPVILLTSKTEVQDRLEGFKRGADAYVAKPFNMEELHILIDNLIDNVRRLRGKFSGAQKQEQKMDRVEVKGNNDALMDRIMKSINQNLADPDFNVERLAEDVGISRAQLHRKMKEMTGISTGDFIRNIRLEQAGRLIREHKINVTQVAYTVGFNNQSHFSTIFKKHFGLTPTEYAESGKED